MKSLIEGHASLVARVMDMQLQRQNVTMSNLANLRTPGYKPRTLEFESELQAALNMDARGKISRTDQAHMPSVFDADGFGASLEKAFKPRIIHGEDRVDLDKEMARMAKTQLQYAALSQVMKSSFDGLRTIIQEGQK